MSRREFKFEDGSSSKFWNIELSGSSFTVHFGRIGTSGQSQKKDFSSDAEAKKQYDKLIAEKLKKGYSEIGEASSVSPPAPTAKPASLKKEPAAQPAPAPTAPPVVNLQVERSIQLDPIDWSIATWRRKQIPLPTPSEFDLQDCLARVAKVPVSGYGWRWNWEAARIPRVMSPEEAHFWIAAMTTAGNKTDPKALAEALGSRPFPGISMEDTIALLKKKQTYVGPEVLLPLVNTGSIEELVEAMCVPAGKRAVYASEQHWQSDPEIMLGFVRYVLPYLSDDEMNRIRKMITPELQPQKWPSDFYERPPVQFYLGAMMGMSSELLPVVQSWKEDAYVSSSWDHTHYHQPQLVVFGLGDAKRIESEMRRLKLPLNRTHYIRGWLATTEYAALDYARDSILSISNREEAEKLLEDFALVIAPEAAPHMLELKLSSKAPKVAREWLEKHIGCTIAGLIPAAAGRGKLADAAIDYLRDLKRSGLADAIVKLAGTDAPQRVLDEVINRVEKTYGPLSDANTPAWLKDALAKSPRAKLPGWAMVHLLPVLVIGENRLNDEQMLALLGALQKTPLGTPNPLISAIRENVRADIRDEFAWRLFEAWLAEGAPSKDKWAMGAIGHLGGDACVLKITPMIRNWPGESQHQRAVFGLECLRNVGSDTSLMQLNGIAQKLKFKGLKTKAMEFMEAIASQRNMTRAELEDRIVPDCDLDEKGTRVFDFGPRQFKFVLGPELKAMLNDASGKVLGDLPKPGAKDDSSKATAAVADWKLLKKQIREIGKVQAERLEQAMVTGRRWSAGDFETLLVKHPLMINFVRLLVWAGYDPSGKITRTFRITEDQTYADETDSQTDLKGLAQVGVAHAADLTGDQKRAWGEILSDYEIVPPFEQVGRSIYTLEPGEISATDITRFARLAIPATTLVGMLERMAWVRGIPQDAGIFYEHTKPFYGANVTAVVNYENGVPVGYMEGWEDQKITNCFFIPGIYTPKMYPEHKNALKLGEVDRIAVSEVLRNLMAIASKAK